MPGDSGAGDTGPGDSSSGPAPELTNLTLSGAATLVPVFAPSTLSYESSVPVTEGDIRVTPTALDPTATILVNGVAVVSGVESSAVTLDLGSNLIDVLVTVAGGASQTYQVDVTRGAATLAQVAYVKASNTEMDDSFGRAIAVSGDTLVVGATGEDSTATGVDGDETNNDTANSGAVYVFRNTGGTWAQEAYLKASNGRGGDNFGGSLALSGDTLAIAARGDDRDSAGSPSPGKTSSGAVYIFQRTGTTWAEEAYLKAAVPGVRDYFGTVVGLDGDLLAVGALGESSASRGIDGDETNDAQTDAGAAYLFRRTGTTWAQEVYVKASNTRAGDGFGTSVAVSGDVLAVGAWREDSNAVGVGGDESNDSSSASGAVYVFRRTTGTWAQEAYVKASNTGTGHNFGMTVALVGDTLAVGAPHESSGATGIGGDESDTSSYQSGAVYVFRRTGGTWAQEAYVKASNTGREDNFGDSLALSGDSLVVGALREQSNATGVNGNQSDDSADRSGAAYLFRWTGAAWEQSDYMKASNTESSDRFGASVAVGGGLVAVGAIREDSNATGIGGDQSNNSATVSGAAYLFE